jgi:hypothetical protein
VARDTEADKRRSGKWIYMVRKMHLNEKVSEKDLKRRARKGIPDSVRGTAWPTLLSSTDVIPEKYSKTFLGKQAWMKTLLNQSLAKKTLQDIFKDITRTLPKHVYF